MKNNFRDRRKPVDMIIIHSMGEFIGDTFAYDFLDDIGLSAHFLVTANGDIIHGVNPDKEAYHAGKSAWEGKEDLNKYSVGIELLLKGYYTYSKFLEAIEKPENFTEGHYKACAKICRDLMDTYPAITKDRILRHSDVSGPEVRNDPKYDPGSGFDMEKLKSMI